MKNDFHWETDPLWWSCTYCGSRQCMCNTPPWNRFHSTTILLHSCQICLFSVAVNLPLSYTRSLLNATTLCSSGCFNIIFSSLCSDSPVRRITHLPGLPRSPWTTFNLFYALWRCDANPLADGHCGVNDIHYLLTQSFIAQPFLASIIRDLSDHSLTSMLLQSSVGKYPKYRGGDEWLDCKD